MIEYIERALPWVPAAGIIMEGEDEINCGKAGQKKQNRKSTKRKKYLPAEEEAEAE